MTNNTNHLTTALQGYDVVKYRDRLYSVKFVNEINGYFLVPVKNHNIDGFWAPANKCTILVN